MCKKTITILAINPGTKYLALAVFRDAELRDWRIKIFKGAWSASKMKRILVVVDDFIERYQVNAVAMKRLHPSRSSRNLNLLVSKMKGIVERRSLEIREYSIKDLERCFCPGEKGSKRKMTEAVLLEYPALWIEFDKERLNSNAYYTRLFEAVALGSICHDEIDKYDL